MALVVWSTTACVALLSVVASNLITVEETRTALVGAEVLLPCQIENKSPNVMQIAWRKANEKSDFIVYHSQLGISYPNESYSRRISFRNHSRLDCSILINPSELQDEGNYFCSVTILFVGTQEKRISLMILDPAGNVKRNVMISCVVVRVVVIVLATFLIVLLIRKKSKAAEGPYVNVPPQRKKAEQDTSDLNSTYMGLKIEEQSVYSELQR